MEQTTVQTESVVEDLTIIQLPDEVQAIALRVSDEKRSEVNLTLQQVFSGTADWKAQVDMIVVKDPSDKMGMNLAKTARLNTKNARLAAEKLFDQKRNEVQVQMLSYQTEDKLWLKAKQTMQILFKEIEAAAEYKEKTAERYENEQHELKIQTRLTRLASVNPEISRQEIELMSDVSFDAFLAGLIAKKEAAEKEAARQAEELRLAALKKERDDARFRQFAGIGLMFSGGQFVCAKGAFDLAELCELDEPAFGVAVSDATKMVAECKAEEVAEKEALIKAAKDRELELLAILKKKDEFAKQAQVDVESFLVESGFEKADGGYSSKEYSHWIGSKHYSSFETEKEVEAFKESITKERALQSERKKLAEEKAKQDAIIAKQKAEIEAKQKQEAEEKAAEAKRIAKEKAEREAAAIAAKAPRKERLTNWVESFEITPFENDEVASDIFAKFTGFKKWAKGQVEKI